MARGHHVGEGEQRRQERRVLTDGQDDQGAVGVRHAHRLALSAIHAIRPISGAVDTRWLKPLAAELAGTVGDQKRCNDQLSDLQRLHV
jgi:hypothetical protein